MSRAALFDELMAHLQAQLHTLPDKPEETPESTLRALWHAAAGAPKSAELAARAALPPLDAGGATVLRELVRRRLDGTPLAHLTQRQRFAELEMLAGPQALVPRKETELLALSAIRLATEMAAGGGTITVIDVCTGSGNVALALAHHVPAARVYAADLSASAVDLARRNQHHLGLDERVEFRTGDLLAPFDSAGFHGTVDLLTCNPPYIASAKVRGMPREIAAHEPMLAFDGGLFGVAILLRLIQEAPRFLRRGGWLACEVGLGQGPILVKQLARNPAFGQVQTAADPAGRVRVVMARAAG
jgi:release factor glutamine methyltransferase